MEKRDGEGDFAGQIDMTKKRQHGAKQIDQATSHNWKKSEAVAGVWACDRSILSGEFSGRLEQPPPHAGVVPNGSRKGQTLSRREDKLIVTVFAVLRRAPRRVWVQRAARGWPILCSLSLIRAPLGRDCPASKRQKFLARSSAGMCHL